MTDSRLDALDAWCRQARPQARADVEVYERRSSRRRVRLGPDGSAQGEEVEESGTAVRLWSDGASRFAAVSGHGPEAAERAATLARGLPPDADAGWGSGPEDREDDDRDEPLPDGAVLESRLRERCAGGGHGWLEVARTEERWAFDGRARARRTRNRSWLRVERSDRGWTRMEGSAGRGWAPPEPAPPPPIEWGPQGWLLEPEAAGSLLDALARSGVLRPGDPVGPGLVLSDEPLHPDGLAGGSFDDAGYRTAGTRLADGRAWLGVPAGPGHLLRPSYRDRPAPSPAHLVAAAVAGGPARAARTFVECRLFPAAAGAWTLLLREEDGGEAVWTTGPGRLAAGVVGTWGPPVPTRSGPRTPGLLVDPRR